jgi:hypothetical protein
MKANLTERQMKQIHEHLPKDAHICGIEKHETENADLKKMKTVKVCYISSGRVLNTTLKLWEYRRKTK